MVEETSGGFDLVAFKQLPSPMPDNPWEYINSSEYWQPHYQYVQPENVTNMIWLPASYVTANYTGKDATGGNRRWGTYHKYCGFQSTLLYGRQLPVVPMELQPIRFRGCRLPGGASRSIVDYSGWQLGLSGELRSPNGRNDL